MPELNTFLKRLQQPSLQKFTHTSWTISSIHILTFRKVFETFCLRILLPFPLKWLTDWLFDWSIKIDQLIDCLIDWLIDDWSTEWMSFGCVIAPTQHWTYGIALEPKMYLGNWSPTSSIYKIFWPDVGNFIPYILYLSLLVGVHTSLSQNSTTPNLSYFLVSTHIWLPWGLV